MKGVTSLSAMGDGIRQRTDDIAELEHRSWPAMRHQQGHRIGLGGAHMQKVDTQPVDLGAVLAQAVEYGLAPSPVVVVSPMVDQGPHLGQWGALAGVVHRFCIRPPSARQAIVEIGQLGLRDVQCEGLDCVVHGGRTVRMFCSWMLALPGCPARRAGHPGRPIRARLRLRQHHPSSGCDRHARESSPCLRYRCLRKTSARGRPTNGRRIHFCRE